MCRPLADTSFVEPSWEEVRVDWWLLLTSMLPPFSVLDWPNVAADDEPASDGSCLICMGVDVSSSLDVTSPSVEFVSTELLA